MHEFWTCSKLLDFWSAVFETVNVRLHLSLPVSPELVLLGVQDDEQRPRYVKLLLSLLFFYAKKAILLKWTSRAPPTVGAWMDAVNAVLPLYKMTYMNWGCPWKFERVWGPWINPL